MNKREAFDYVNDQRFDLKERLLVYSTHFRSLIGNEHTSGTLLALDARHRIVELEALLHALDNQNEAGR